MSKRKEAMWQKIETEEPTLFTKVIVFILVGVMAIGLPVLASISAVKFMHMDDVFVTKVVLIGAVLCILIGIFFLCGNKRGS